MGTLRHLSEHPGFKRKPARSRRTTQDLIQELDQIDQLSAILRAERDAHEIQLEEASEQITNLEEQHRVLEKTLAETTAQLEASYSKEDLAELKRRADEADSYADRLEELVGELARLAVREHPQTTRQLLLRAAHDLPQNSREFPWRLLPPFI